MATTQEDLKQSHDDYSAAFNEEPPARVEPTEDEAFGIEPEPAAEAPSQAEEPPAEGAAAEEPPAQAGEAAPAGKPDAAIIIISDKAADGEPSGQTAVEAAGDTPEDGATPGEAGVPEGMAQPGEAAVEAHAPVEVQPAETGANGAPKGPMTEQQLRSWEGRLRKAEADLASKRSASEPPAEAEAGALEEVSAQAEGKNPEMASAVSNAADAVESGEASYEDVSKQLAEDFGEDFVRMIEVIAAKKAQDAGAMAANQQVGEMGKTVEAIISHIKDGAARQHFKEIAAENPDFAEIGQSEGFRQFIDAMPEAEKAEATRVATGGSSTEINQLLKAYKATLQDDTAQQTEEAAAPATDPVVDAAMDAAEGVRSSGMALPEQPSAANDGYEAAWAEFK